MQCQVEKAGRKDELWSPHFKIRWQVNMTKIVMFSHGGKTQWSYSHHCMITRYDHIFCMITCVCVMIAIVLIQDTMVISWRQYHRRSQVCVAEAHWRGNFIWRVHIVMCTDCDDHILWWSHIVMITCTLHFSEFPFTSEQTWIKRRYNGKLSTKIRSLIITIIIWSTSSSSSSSF